MAESITPPPELVRHWSRFQGDTDSEALWFRIANEAAQWGADQELEACCEWADETGWQGAGDGLRTTRRPTCRENTKRPSGPPPLKLRRSDTAASTRLGPTTQKPNIIPRGQSFGGYQPRPRQGTPNPPPSEP